MAKVSALNDIILEQVQHLPEKDKQEVLSFIEYLRLKKQQPFIEYVNQRTRQAVAAKQRGEHFTSLDELQQEYA